jgi:putative heme-binding domain-containing protein
VLQPSVEIASGYESILIQTAAGQILDGVVQRETSDSLWLASAEGEVMVLAVTDIARRRIQEVSLMPGNLAEVLTVTQLHDLLAYLLTLQ